MVSPWRNPLPQGKYTNSRVVVYFYCGRWVPVMYYSLEKAIELYRKSKLNGKEIFAFPAKLNPSDFCAELTAHSCSCGDNNKAYKAKLSTQAIDNPSDTDSVPDGYAPLEAEEIDQLTPTESSTN